MDFKTIEEIDIQLVKKTDKLIGEINEKRKSKRNVR